MEGGRGRALPAGQARGLLPFPCTDPAAAAPLSEAAVAWLRGFPRRLPRRAGPPGRDLSIRPPGMSFRSRPSTGRRKRRPWSPRSSPRNFSAGAGDAGRRFPMLAIDMRRAACQDHRRIAVSGGIFPAFQRRGPLDRPATWGLWTRRQPVIFGRRDDIVLTGGEKVSSTEVEAALR